MQRYVTILFAALALALVAPGAALAADASLDGYGGPAGTTESEVQGATPKDPGTAAETKSAGPNLSQALPFTGLDTLFLAGTGLALMGFGLGLRRIGSPRRAL